MSQQCEGKTTNGNRCKREASDGRYCYAHADESGSEVEASAVTNHRHAGRAVVR